MYFKLKTLLESIMYHSTKHTCLYAYLHTENINITLKRVGFLLYMNAPWTERQFTMDLLCMYALWTKKQLIVDLHS